MKKIVFAILLSFGAASYADEGASIGCGCLNSPSHQVAAVNDPRLFESAALRTVLVDLLELEIGLAPKALGLIQDGGEGAATAMAKGLAHDYQVLNARVNVAAPVSQADTRKFAALSRYLKLRQSSWELIAYPHAIGHGNAVLGSIESGDVAFSALIDSLDSGITD